MGARGPDHVVKALLWHVVPLRQFAFLIFAHGSILQFEAVIEPFEAHIVRQRAERVG